MLEMQESYRVLHLKTLLTMVQSQTKPLRPLDLITRYIIEEIRGPMKAVLEINSPFSNDFVKSTVANPPVFC